MMVRWWATTCCQSSYTVHWDWFSISLKLCWMAWIPFFQRLLLIWCSDDGLCSIAFIWVDKKRPQRKIQIFIVELPTAAAPHSEIYLTAKHRKQIHSVTLIFQPRAVDITMYICVRVSQEDFFFDEGTRSQEAIKPFSILCIILVNFLQSVFIYFYHDNH